MIAKYNNDRDKYNEVDLLWVAEMIFELHGPTKGAGHAQYSQITFPSNKIAL